MTGILAVLAGGGRRRVYRLGNETVYREDDTEQTNEGRRTSKAKTNKPNTRN